MTIGLAEAVIGVIEEDTHDIGKNLGRIMIEINMETEKVFRAVKKLINQNIDILAPACGLSTSTPLANIRAFTGAVRES
jgi:[methyl-Co(III) methanol-specific corrinoid protein]:coenzyme M methyltransferase